MQHLPLELCMELMKAGWPKLDGRFGWYEVMENGKVVQRVMYHNEASPHRRLAPCPTLEELIAACKHPTYPDNLHLALGNNVWVAQIFAWKKPDYEGRGTTPAEAVARLWLALQKDRDNDDHR